MKKKIKYILSSILICTLVIIFCGCSSNPLLNYVSMQGSNIDTSTQLPKDGLNGVDGKDGKDGDSIDLYNIYEQLYNLGEFTGTYAEFVKEYLNSESTKNATNKALNSVVSIYSAFTSTITYNKTPQETETFIQKGYGAGAGVIFRIDKSTGDALIITNYHVVYDNNASPQISNEIAIFLYGNQNFTIQTVDSISDGWKTYKHQKLISESKIVATYLGGSMLYDIAVLKVTGNELLKNSSAEAATFADSNDICVGETAIAVGNPSGMGISATQGVISVDSEYITMTGADGRTPCQFRVIRTDSAINSGNSGGGLFNGNGELIGITNAKITSSTIENIGYAIPSNVACNVAENIVRNCNGVDKTSVKRCILGITIGAKTSSAVSKYTENGYITEIVETVYIDDITKNSVAENLFSVGDILTKLTINYQDGSSITKSITRTFHLVDLSLTLSAGDTLIIERTNSLGSPLSNVSITFTDEHIVEFA